MSPLLCALHATSSVTAVGRYNIPSACFKAVALLAGWSLREKYRGAEEDSPPRAILSTLLLSSWLVDSAKLRDFVYD